MAVAARRPPVRTEHDAAAAAASAARNAPKFRAAQTACAKLLPAGFRGGFGGGRGGGGFGGNSAAFAAYRNCLTLHGVKLAAGARRLRSPGRGGKEPSAKEKAALKACASLRPAFNRRPRHRDGPEHHDDVVKRLGITRRAAAFYAVLVGAIAVAAWFAYSTIYDTSSSASSGVARTVTVSSGTVASSVSASGNISAAETASPTFSTSGTLTSLNASVGKQVTKGQVLGRISATDAQATLATARRRCRRTSPRSRSRRRAAPRRSSPRTARASARRSCS